MSEEEITQWLIMRGRKKGLSIELAKQLAAKSRLGWFIAPHSYGRFTIGKITLQKLSSRHIVTDDDGKALTFATVEEAKAFLRDELAILVPHVFWH